MPVAVDPLWQLKQPLVTALWSKRASRQLLMPWQSSHRFELAMWLGDFPPAAMLPMWQLPQLSPVLPWSMRAGSQKRVTWQSLHEL